MANWYSLITLIVHVLILVYFIILAIALQNVLNATPLPSSINTGRLNFLYIVAIILAIASGISALVTLMRFFRGNHIPHPGEDSIETITDPNKSGYQSLSTQRKSAAVVTQHPDGAISTQHPSGKTVTQHPSGEVVTQHPNGAITSTHPYGQVNLQPAPSVVTTSVHPYGQVNLQPAPSVQY